MSLRIPHVIDQNIGILKPPFFSHLSTYFSETPSIPIFDVDPSTKNNNHHTSKKTMKTVLIVGANRGLGASLAHQYASLPNHRVYATARYHAPTTNPYPHSLTYIPNIDITHENTARLISLQWAESTGTKLDLLIVCASYFHAETLSTLNMDKEIQMYKTTSIGPIFLVKGLVDAGLLGNGSCVVLVGSEMGGLGLRHESDVGLGGGGNYGGCGSKAALHMGGRLLSMDLKKLGVAVGIVHTGYLRVEKEGGIWEGGEGENGGMFCLFSFAICCYSCRLVRLNVFTDFGNYSG